MYPWEYSREISTYHGMSYRGGRRGSSTHYKYTLVKEYIDDSPRQYWRKGDIVKFDDGFVPPTRESWVDWFATKRDQKKFWKRIPAIARYADNQLAIIIGRYRKIKLKYSTFIDYGVVTMMLTGPKAGKIRHYWNIKPFVKKCIFPEKIKFKYMLDAIPPEVVKIYNQPHEDTNEGRNQMLYEIYKVFHKE